jgi:ParB family chromosome partitioning protein
MSKKGLGKGLSALMGGDMGDLLVRNETRKEIVSAQDKEDFDNVTYIPIDMLVVGKYQPRRKFNEEALNELSSSISKNGILQPILVRRLPNSNLEIIAGERRWRAAKIANIEIIPVIIKNIDDKEALEIALIENIQRQDLTIIEEAEGYDRLLQEFSYTQDDLAKKVGKSRSHVANLLRLLTLPSEIKLMINSGSLSMGHARTLIGIDNNIDIANQIVEKGLNVRKTEKMIKAINNYGKTKNNSSGTLNERDEDLVAIESSLSNSLGLRVKIEDVDKGGVVSLYFENLEQLDRIIQRLSEGL